MILATSYGQYQKTIISWELTTNEKGVKMATLPQADLIALISYANQCEHRHAVSEVDKIARDEIVKPCEGCTRDCYNWQIGDCKRD